MDIHVVVQGNISVNEGHQIGHEVKNSLLESEIQITDVTVHVEPNDF
jgi:divalent metal cation (Fe/Co/Zn/Cd) transporter